MSYYLVPDPIINAYKEACRVDATNEWHHFMSYVTGYKAAMLDYSVSPMKHEVVSQLQFLWSMAMYRSNNAAHVFRRT